MSTTRRVTAPSGLGSSSVAASRKSGALSSTPRSTAGRATIATIGSDGRKSDENGGGLIVTRGLQELLEKERHNQRPIAATPSPRAGGASSKSKSKGQRRSLGQAPNFVICYLCGRQFGTASIDIHRPQCYLKRLITWERSDCATRGPKPLGPEEHEKLMKARMGNNRSLGSSMNGSSGVGRAVRAAGAGGFGNHAPLTEVERYNQMQMDVFNDTSLAPCPNCGRTFLPDRLQVHLRSCKPGHTARPIRPASTPPTATAAAPVPAAAAAPPSKRAAAPVAAKERHLRAATANQQEAVLAPAAAPTRRGPNKAIASYIFPDSDAEEKGEDGGSAPPANGSSPPSPAPARGRPSIRVLSVTAAPKCAAVSATAGDVIEVEMEAEAEETRPPSPRPDTEKRLSRVAVTGADAEMLGSSRPNRPTSMEPGVVPPGITSPTATDDASVGNGHGHGHGHASQGTTSPGHSPLLQSRGKEHAAGSRPRRLGTPSAPRSDDAPATAAAAAAAAAVSHGDDGSGDDDDAPLRSAPVVTASAAPGRVSADETAEQDRPRKIPLNNVSRFKNVQSRLHVHRESAEAVLVPCRFCSRTFLPERVQKHEDCCIERNKPLTERNSSNGTPRLSTASSVPSAAKATATPAPKRSQSSPNAQVVVEAAPASKGKFCGGCGGRVSSAEQKFCTECGHKL